MAYNEFAYFYDEFNGEADYDALYGYITDELKAHGITDGILADLGCGTGDLTLMLTQAGYDVIGIDRSEEMLSVLREKADELGLTGRLLLLKQDLLDLDLYGTIRAAEERTDKRQASVSLFFRAPASSNRRARPCFSFFVFSFIWVAP